MKAQEKQSRQASRANRTHVKARVSGAPRLVVCRSNTSIYAQIVDDASGKIVCGTSGLKLKSTGIKRAEEVGTKIAELAKAKKVTTVAFDRNGFAYHGNVKALADAARKGGLKF
jgi:large subunit ribosomal protein L18